MPEASDSFCERRKNPDCSAMLATLTAESKSLAERQKAADETLKVVFKKLDHLTAGASDSSATLAGMKVTLESISTALKSQQETLKALPEIQAQTTKTNGSVIRHEEDIKTLKADTKDFADTKNQVKSWSKVSNVVVGIVAAVATALILKLLGMLSFSPAKP